MSSALDASDPYDAAIVGAGAAGLVLAWMLAHGPFRNKRVAVIDRDPTRRRHRTWSYWSDVPTPFDVMATRHWDTLRVCDAAHIRVLPLTHFRYYTILGQDLYDGVLNALVDRPGFESFEHTVVRIEDEPSYARVVCEETEIRARWVFDSRPMGSGPDESPPDDARGRWRLLRQYFRGWTVETPENAFDPSMATLFDFRTPQEGDMKFFYLLPLTERRALVELVQLRSDPHENAMKNYLSDILSVRCDWTITNREAGATVLTDRPFVRRVSKHVLSIGARGGRVKPSSGYGFTRMILDARAIVRSLERFDHPFDLPGARVRDRFLDAVMLEAMGRHPEAMARVFARMMLRSPIERVFALLDERATFAQIAALAMTLPWGLFLGSALHAGTRRIRGALVHRTREK